MPDYEVTEYVGDGAETEYTIGFPFITNDEIIIELDDVVLSDTGYDILADKVTVSLDVAPANLVAIRIRRMTDIQDVQPVYQDDTGLNASALNEAVQRSYYAHQEHKANEGALAPGEIPAGAPSATGGETVPIATGTSGQVLTSNGVGLPASFEDVVGQADGAEFRIQLSDGSAGFTGLTEGVSAQYLRSAGPGFIPFWDDGPSSALPRATLLQSGAIGAGSIDEVKMGFFSGGGEASSVNYNYFIMEFGGLIHESAAELRFQMIDDEGNIQTTAGAYYSVGDDRIATSAGQNVQTPYDFAEDFVSPMDLHMGTVVTDNRRALHGRITMRYPYVIAHGYGGEYEFWQQRDSGANAGMRHVKGAYNYDATITGNPGGIVLQTQGGGVDWTGSNGYWQCFGVLA